MAEDDKKQDPIDLDNLTDEEFMKLDAPSGVAEPTEEKKDEGTDADGGGSDADDQAEASGSGDATDGDSGSDGLDQSEGGGAEGSGSSEGLTEEEKAEAEAKAADKAAQAEAEATKGVNDDKETMTLPNKGEKEETDDEKVAREAEEAEAVAAEAQENATNFFDKVSAPFKADGKEVQVRTPEEAIRLMQMGVNYSRRMSEMKPLREMDATLTQHGLNNPEKLNELIDLSKGGKEAIQKFLKKHNIDPLDLDPSKGDTHQTPNYRSDPVDVAFQEAIDNTLRTEGGKELLGDVNRDWDDESKEALRENPSIFGKLLEQRDSGVYSQINAELQHQWTMGYLADVPFLQAYEQVGNAMKKAGVFDKKEEPQKKTGLAPIGSGSRKAAPKPKTELPNPNLSSANKSHNAVKETAPKEPDYLSMSDEDFMNLAVPS